MLGCVKKLFSEQIFDILSYESGFIIVYRRPEIEDKVAVSFRSVSLENGVVSQRTKSDYEFIKFGENHTNANFKVGNFVTSSCVKLPNGNVFVVSDEGEARILDPEGYIEWQGTIRYKECGPASIAHHGHTLWASFPERNALIRFNLRTMREELRIGGSADSSFAGPKGLWVNEAEDKLIVCNEKANNILEVNMKTYTVHERASFEEPVHKYVKIGKNELVVLDSGLYLL